MSRLYGIARFGLDLPEPALWLDLVGGQVNKQIAWGRVSNDEVVGPAGKLATLGHDRAPYEHDPRSLRCRGVRIWQLDTNLAKFSEDRSNGAGYLTGGRTTIGAADGADPRGNAGMQQVLETTDNGSHPNQTVNYTTVAGLDYTGALWLAKLGRRYVTLAHVRSSGVIEGWATFDLDNGTVHAEEAGSTGIIENWGGGIYRAGVVYPVTTTSQNIGIWLNEDGADGVTGTYIGDVSKGVYAWGSTFTQGNYLPPYIPTTSSQVTRNALTATMGPVTVGGVAVPFEGYSQGVGSIFFSAELPAAHANADRYLFQLDDGTANNRLSLLLQGSVADEIKLYVLNGGAVVAAPTGPAPAAGSVVNLAVAYKSNSVRFAVNGTEYTPDTSVAIPNFTRLLLGQAGGGDQLNGYVREFGYWPQYLPDAIKSITA